MFHVFIFHNFIILILALATILFLLYNLLPLLSIQSSTQCVLPPQPSHSPSAKISKHLSLFILASPSLAFDIIDDVLIF